MKLFNFCLIALTPAFHIFCNSVTSGEAGKEPKPVNIIYVNDMHETRAAHTAVLLKNGTVLLTGGFRKRADGHSQLYSKTSEIFDPHTRSFTGSGDMHIERCDHSATLLPDGDVLVAGGTNGTNLASAELYDCKTGTWKTLTSMKAARAAHAAVLLPNNEVLIVGGSASPETFAELFNCKSKRFEKIIPAPVNIAGAAVVLLRNGKVLVAGGNMGRQPTDYAFIYDPASASFLPAGRLRAVRHKASVAILENGNALLIGGADSRDWQGKYSSTEIYDVKKNSFMKGPPLNFERFKLMNAVVTLKDGSIITSGGDRHIEILKPGALQFETIGELKESLYYSTSTLLSDGSILIAGGYGNDVQAKSKACVFNSTLEKHL